MKIPFNKPYMTGKELFYIAEAHFNNMLSGDGPFTKKCHQWLEQKTGCKKALLTHSCTAALEMAAILADIQEGDEVIMPSYTFTSTANAFVLRGGIPIFIDVRNDTLNIDESLIKQAITNKTKAIVVVHYAGVSCEMDEIMSIAEKHNLIVIEDAAQGVLSTYKGKAVGSIGHLGCYSFHETKNIISGEGGALLINDERLVDRAEIIREKGTNRSNFFRGKVDKYNWCDLGSSFLPGELVAAFLWAQLQEANDITEKRLDIWARYHDALISMERKGFLRRPFIPESIEHNAHMYYVILSDDLDRQAVLKSLNEHEIGAVFHYVPLHTAPAGKKYCKISGDFKITDSISQKLIRLPMWLGITEAEQTRVILELESAINQHV